LLLLLLLLLGLLLLLLLLLLLHCRLMREYLELEFTAALADKQLSFAMDVERIIDDVVLFCMLVGNDFLPGGFVNQARPGKLATSYIQWWSFGPPSCTLQLYSLWLGWS
jgi:hypothetical protein